MSQRLVAGRYRLDAMIALLDAHAHGIVHRDVKPSNILISDNRLTQLTYFGIARNSAEHTGTELVVESPAYLAPEISNGSPTGPASDAWGPGATLFACVEGHPPFDRDTGIDTGPAIVNDPVPPHLHPGPLEPAISAQLCW